MYAKWSKDLKLLDLLRNATANSFSVAEALTKCGVTPNGANYKGFKDACLRLGFSTDHFKGQAHLKGKRHNWGKKKSFDEILVVNSSYLSTSSLKQRLLRAGLLELKCYICHCSAEWRSKPLTLQLDHINGEATDNRIENLRILCPNCHSQTETFAGKNK